jgi:hypothetical protein
MAGNLRAGRRARSSKRDNSNGTTACIATALAIHTSTPAGLGMRLTQQSIARPG